MHRSGQRKALALVGAVAVVLATWVGQASAHVSIDTLGTARQGDELTKLGFAVPNESDTASTVKVEVQMPQDTPLTFVAVQPKPGWDVTTTTRTLATPITGEGGTIDSVIDTVTWTATGDTVIGPGQFDEFWVSVGPMPDTVDALEFPTLQTYDNGDIVRWIEPTPASGVEPEHPMPTLALLAAQADSPPSATTSADGTDILTVIALVIACVGLAAAVAALVLARRRAGTDTSTTM